MSRRTNFWTAAALLPMASKASFSRAPFAAMSSTCIAKRGVTSAMPSMLRAMPFLSSPPIIGARTTLCMMLLCQLSASSSSRTFSVVGRTSSKIRFGLARSFAAASFATFSVSLTLSFSASFSAPFAASSIGLVIG